MPVPLPSSLLGWPAQTGKNAYMVGGADGRGPPVTGPARRPPCVAGDAVGSPGPNRGRTDEVGITIASFLVAISRRKITEPASASIGEYRTVTIACFPG
jgi:hypothetical protein